MTTKRASVGINTGQHLIPNRTGMQSETPRSGTLLLHSLKGLRNLHALLQGPWQCTQTVTLLARPPIDISPLYRYQCHKRAKGLFRNQTILYLWWLAMSASERVELKQTVPAVSSHHLAGILMPCARRFSSTSNMGRRRGGGGNAHAVLPAETYLFLSAISSCATLPPRNVSC